jgi:flagellar biosynthetic protein FliQ
VLIEDQFLQLVRQALIIVLKISTPVLGAGIVIGLAISIFQSVTSIQEQTLALVPKIVIMTVVTIVLLPWIIAMLANFSVEMFTLA